MSRSTFPASRLKRTYIDYLAKMIGSKSHSEEHFAKELDRVLNVNPGLINGQDENGNTMIHLCFLHSEEGYLQTIISKAESKGITLQIPNNNNGKNPAELTPVNDKTIFLIKQLASYYQERSLEEFEQAIEDTDLQSLIYEINDSATDQKLLASIEGKLTPQQKALNHAQREGYADVVQAMSIKHDKILAKELGTTLEEYYDKKDYFNSLSDEKLLRHIAKGLPKSKVKTSKSETLAPIIITTNDL